MALPLLIPIAKGLATVGGWVLAEEAIRYGVDSFSDAPKVGPTVQAAKDIDKLKINPSTKSGGAVASKAKKIWDSWKPKSKTGWALKGASAGMTALWAGSSIAGAMTDDKVPTENIWNSIQDDTKKNIASGLSYEDLLKKELKIDYTAKVREDSMKQLSRMIEDKDITDTSMQSLSNNLEGRIHNSWVQSVAGLFQMQAGHGSDSYEKATAEYGQLKGLLGSIRSQASIIANPNTSESEKNNARQGIISVKDNLFGLAQRRAELRESIKTANNLMVTNFNMLKSINPSGKNGKGNPLVNATMLNTLLEITMSREDLSEDEKQSELGKISKYIKSLIPGESGGGLSGFNMLQAFQNRGK